MINIGNNTREKIWAQLTSIESLQAKDICLMAPLRCMHTVWVIIPLETMLVDRVIIRKYDSTTTRTISCDFWQILDLLRRKSWCRILPALRTLKLCKLIFGVKFYDQKFQINQNNIVLLLIEWAADLGWSRMIMPSWCTEFEKKNGSKRDWKVKQWWFAAELGHVQVC